MTTMTYEDARKTIRDHFDSEWNNIIPVLYQNEPGSIGDEPYFARLTIKPTEGRQAAVGGRPYRRQGLVFVQLFAEQGRGMDALGSLEQTAVKIFEDANAIVEGITFFNARADDIGPDGRGYYQSNVKAEFRFDTS